MESKTTFTSSIEMRSSVELPSLIFCPSPQIFKYDNFEKYNVTSNIWDAVIRASEYNLTMIEMYNEFTYILERDYNFQYFDGDLQGFNF